ncbi:sulfurtransferase TusA family protein [bacterium]|nr:sulfurtransferase TusA family protein [bacterium]
MATIKLDATGLRCPQPILKIASKMPEINKGDILEVTADCPTFEDDVRKWCTRMKKTLLAISTGANNAKTAQIQF